MRSHDDRQTVIAMSRAGQSIRQIGRTLKMSPKTIRRILDGTAADHIQRPSRYQDLIPLIRELFVRFDGNVVSIQKELACQYGHNIPYTSLTHLVRNENLRPEKTKRSGTFLYLPGREAQHDTSAHQVTIAGKTVKAQCASMVLAHCRLLFFQYYPRFTRFEAKLFLSAALEYFDGVPQTCIIDNTSVLVAAGSGPDAVIAPEMQAFGAIYGMRFVAHAIGHADRSALVERNFHYIENSFLPGQAFKDWQTLNDAARSWCDTVANNKIKRALAMTARQAWQSEKPFLKPLPAVKPPVYQNENRTVDMYGYVTVDTNRYSVPEHLCGKMVQVQKDLYEVRILYNRRPVACHARLLDRRDAKSTIAGHHQRPVARTDQRPSPLMRQLLGHSPQMDRYVARIGTRSRSGTTRQLQRLLAIKHQYPAIAFDAAIARCLHYGVYDLDRLEKIILNLVAGDFFQLEPHEPDNP
jgi:hypothetical protein